MNSSCKSELENKSIYLSHTYFVFENINELVLFFRDSYPLERHIS